MTTKHTPGPWQVNLKKSSNTRDFDMPCIVGKFNVEIARVATDGQRVDSETNLANANLIAVSAELLEILQQAMAPFAHIADENLILDWQRSARAAIAKVTGSQSSEKCDSEKCDHEFENGICKYCFCPESPEDTDKAIAALDASK